MRNVPVSGPDSKAHLRLLHRSHLLIPHASRHHCHPPRSCDIQEANRRDSWTLFKLLDEEGNGDINLSAGRLQGLAHSWPCKVDGSQEEVARKDSDFDLWMHLVGSSWHARMRQVLNIRHMQQRSHRTQAQHSIARCQPVPKILRPDRS